MKHSSESRQPRFRPPAPWKAIVIIVVVIAMPLFFAYYRAMRLQQVLGPAVSTPQATTPPAPKS